MNKDSQLTKHLNLPDIITGGGDFVPENRQMFYYNFPKTALAAYINLFRFFATSNKSESLESFKQLLINQNERLLAEGVFPLECMLYASRIICKDIEDDEQIVEMLASTIPNFAYTPIEGDATRAIINIISLWDWSEQLLVVLCYLGQYKCIEIIDVMMEDAKRRRLLGLHPRLKHAFIKMIFKTKNQLYSENLVKYLLINTDPDEKNIINETIQNYEACGFDKEVLKKYLYNSSDGYKKITNQVLSKQELKVARVSSNHSVMQIIDRLDNINVDNQSKEEVDQLIINLKGRNVDPSVFSNLYRQLIQRRKDNRNEYLGDALAANIIPICSFAKRYHYLYRIIANHISLEKGLVFFETELKRNPLYVIEIYACLTILDPINQAYRQKIVELACKERLSLIDKNALDFIFNYRKQLFEGFLECIINFLEINSEPNLLITFNNLKELCDFKDHYRHIERPAQLDLIKAIGSYLEKHSRSSLKVQSWCLKILELFRQERKFPIISSNILVDVTSGAYFSPPEIRSLAEEIIKKNVETERPS